jgi:hypothetical protein
MHPTFCQVYGPHNYRNVNDHIDGHQFVAYEDPICKERNDDHRHYRQTAQNGGAHLSDIPSAYQKVNAEQKHWVDNHFHMGHHAFLYWENIP